MASDGAKTADVSLTSDVADHSLDHPAKTSKAAEELAEGIDGDDGQEEDDEMDGHGDAVHVDGQSNNGAATRKKKKSKKRKPKAGTTDMSSAQALSEASPASTKQMPVQDIQSLLHQLSMSQSDAGKKDGKPAEDYKFWNTQPVPKFSEPNLLQTTNPTADGESLPEGPILPDKICRASAKPEPGKLVDGFEWCLVDLDDPQEITELYDLLDNHYVEDTDGSFRFKYSIEFLSWALKPPGWKKDWHIGVRTKSVDTQKKGKLVAFIAGIPVTIKVGPATLQASEINFLAIHRKLRGKRLAPELIKEITRRCYRNDIFQALYTAGTLLPTPITTCRYYHRSLDWEQLYKVGFSHLPRGSSEYKQKLRYKLEPQTSLPGLRAMQRKDVPAVRTLLISYLERFHLRQEWSPEEIEHWFCSAASKDVVWSYVVEDPTTGQVTDFMSYYLLESTVLRANTTRKETVRAAYLYYYATLTPPHPVEPFTMRLSTLIHDLLILAKNNNMHVLNAVSLLDNPLFLKEQKFEPGDGKLHYYLFNWRTKRLGGGIDDQGNLARGRMGGIGVVML